MVVTCIYFQNVFTVKVKRHKIWTLNVFQEYCYFSLAIGQFWAKVAYKELSICEITTSKADVVSTRLSISDHNMSQ